MVTGAPLVTGAPVTGGAIIAARDGDAIGPALVGLRLGPVEHRWSPRDAILYSLGIGARQPHDLEFLYEGCGPRIEPTFR